MSRSYDTALDFLPSTKTGPNWKKLFNTVKEFLYAIDNGREAKHAYATLRAHGVDPSRAAETVFARHFSK